jgi:thiol-disulfide isomerase/thioredoxin
MGQRVLRLRSAAALVALHALCASGWAIVPCSLSAMRAFAPQSSRPGLFPALRSQREGKRVRAWARPRTAPRMAGELSVSVQSVTSAPMATDNCKDVCQQALGFVTCKVSGGTKLVMGAQEPLANSYYAVGASAGGKVIVPCPAGTEVGATLSVPGNLAVPVPGGWKNEEAGLFPALCIPFLENLQSAGISLSELAGKSVVVIGGQGPAGSVALQLASAAGARVVATGSGWGAEKSLRALGAQQVVDYKRDSFLELVQDIFLVIDALGVGDEEAALRKLGIQYVSVMHPAVALVVREGLWSGGQQLQRHASGKADACQFEPSEEAMLMIKSAAELLSAGGVTPSYGKTAYTASEWLEAMGWPKDADTGGRFGFPGRSLWESPGPAYTSIKWADEEDFLPVGLPSEDEVYRLDKEAEDEALKEIFDRYDADGSGKIDREEMRAAAQELRLGVTDDELDSLVKKLDLNGDGQISFDEFKQSNIARVLEIDSMDRLKELTAAGSPPTLIEFHAPFCRTCRNMRGRFARLPGLRPHAQFLSVDVKKQRALADELGIKDVPSYVLFKDGERRGQWKGAFRVDQLENFLDGA